jgi:hypothetical protein
MILSASRLILFSFHPELYAIPHPKPAGTIMVTADRVLCIHKHIHIKVSSYINFRQK